MKVLRSILSVLAGIAIAGTMIFALEAAGHKAYPPPPEFASGDIEAMRAAMPKLQTGAFVSLLIAWAFGTMAGGCLAAFIARRARNLQKRRLSSWRKVEMQRSTPGPRLSEKDAARQGGNDRGFRVWIQIIRTAPSPACPWRRAGG